MFTIYVTIVPNNVKTLQNTSKIDYLNAKLFTHGVTKLMVVLSFV